MVINALRKGHAFIDYYVTRLHAGVPLFSPGERQHGFNG